MESHYKKGRLNFKGQGIIDVHYFFISEDNIQFIKEDGSVWVTHYKSLIV